MIPLFLAVNNFVHDFASAMWVASILVIYYLAKKAIGTHCEVSSALLGLAKVFRLVLVGSIAVIFVTGVVRTITYNYFLKQTQIHTYALLVKHAILVLLAVLSFVYVWSVIGRWKTEKQT